ncbi:MAG: Putative transposase, YhgA-like [Candidatus Kentron sp. G]|nr:MAG: Putative transposase, YhgA-like [Candidatus Kentron sp. G]VFN02247.1 MAG: Putative transposase, YhgA-like [Candidatus Kentron sp. G]
MTGGIAHPYDRFMKELLSQPERADMLLRERLPEAVTRQLSDEPPEPMRDSFVDERLREYFSDRLFRVTAVNAGQPNDDFPDW